jgi:hypothetical protein
MALYYGAAVFGAMYAELIAVFCVFHTAFSKKLLCTY